MGRYLSHAVLISEVTGCLVALVHHQGKNLLAGARGHSSFYGALDSQITVTADDAGNHSFETSKQRDGASGLRIPFRLEIVDLGLHPHSRGGANERLTSCVAVADEYVPAKPKPKVKLSGVGTVALQALKECISDKGQVMPETSSIPRGVRAVTLQVWRERFSLRYGTDGRKEDSTRKAFDRGREDLMKNEKIGISSPHVWLWP